MTDPDCRRQPILLVEDNPDDQLLTRRAFAKNAILNPLVIANDGVEALALLHGAEPLRPALVMLDLNLPRLNGHEVLARIRGDERTRHLPVVILTSSSGDEDILRSHDLAANSYIRKPVDFTEFQEVVGRTGLHWLTPDTGAPERILTTTHPASR